MSRPLAGLMVLFFGSGASALVYQVLWTRLLSLVFGVTVHAATTVLASFMAGLAFGSVIAGRLTMRTRTPLRWFGTVEIAIAVLGLATQLALPVLGGRMAGLQASLPDSVGVQTLVRFIGSMAILLGPTTLMGMTLPLMLSAAATGREDGGRRVGLLYATNTAGAVTGALATGFVLIGALGMTWSFRLAALLNFVVGLVAIWWARTEERLPQIEKRSRGDEPGNNRGFSAGPFSSGVPRLALWVFATSGFASLALEIVWFRILVYFVPATTYAFSTMLAAVLLGLSLGAYAGTPFLKNVNRLHVRLGWTQLATAVAVPLFATAIAGAYRAGWHTTADIHISIVLAFPPAFLMGMSYPLGLRLWGHVEGDSVNTTRVGNLNAVNLLGGIAGAVIAGFVILPRLGTRTGLIALAIPYLVNALLITRSATRTGAPALTGAAIAVVSAVVSAVALTVPDLLNVASARRHPPGEQPLWSHEGSQTTVAVKQRADGGRVLYLDGLHQASDAPDIVHLHRMIGHLPMALHPAPRRSIVIGLGGGVTPGAVSQHETTVDVVELSPSVVDAAGWFSQVNYAVTTRPNVRLRVDDGRNFLLARSGRYDVMTADLIQPEHAGAGLLYSREYFSLMRDALADGGLALQWVGHRPSTEYRLIVRTFLDVFPHTTLWSDGQLLVGTTTPLRVSRTAYERKLTHTSTRQALESVGLGSFDTLSAQFVAGPDEIRTFVGDGPRLSDDRPLLEYFRSLPAGSRDIVDLSGLRSSVAPYLVE